MEMFDGKYAAVGGDSEDESFDGGVAAQKPLRLRRKKRGVKLSKVEICPFARRLGSLRSCARSEDSVPHRWLDHSPTQF